MITWERLKELLDYNSETRIFTRKVNTGNFKAGSITGSVNSNGYVVIEVDGKKYYAHRLAWFYVYGKWPTNQIHHMNKIKTDNRICNLADVTNQKNNSDKAIHDRGHLLGTTFDKDRNKWIAKPTINCKQKFLGRYDTAIEAHAVAWIASR